MRLEVIHKGTDEVRAQASTVTRCVETCLQQSLEANWRKTFPIPLQHWSLRVE
jgi:hypothetical protein